MYMEGWLPCTCHTELVEDLALGVLAEDSQRQFR